MLTRSLISAGGGDWDSGGGAAGDTWTEGPTDTGANAGNDFGATNGETNGEVAMNGGGGGDFTCRR